MKEATLIYLKNKEYDRAIIPYESRRDMGILFGDNNMLKEYVDIFDYMMANDPESVYALLAAINLCKCRFDRFEDYEGYMLKDYIKRIISEKYQLKGIFSFCDSILVENFSAKPELTFPFSSDNYTRLVLVFNRILNMEDKPYPANLITWLSLLGNPETDDETIISESAKFLEHPDDNVVFIAAEIMAGIYMKHRLWFNAEKLIKGIFSSSMSFILGNGRTPNAAPRLFKAMCLEMEIAAAGEENNSSYHNFFKQLKRTDSKGYHFNVLLVKVYCKYLRGNYHKAQHQWELLYRYFEKTHSRKVNGDCMFKMGSIIHPTFFNGYLLDKNNRFYYEYLLSRANEAYRAEDYEYARELCLRIPINELTGELYCTYRADYCKLMSDICEQTENYAEMGRFIDKYIEYSKQADDILNSDDLPHKAYIERFNNRIKNMSPNTTMNLIIIPIPL